MPKLALEDAEIHYDELGRGTPIVFLQGVGGEGRAWSPQVDALARDYRCVAIDNRGVGRSRGDTSRLTVDLMARDALAVVDALGAERVHLVGHSLGGVIVQRMALLAKPRVASLTFMCTFAGGRDLAVPALRLIWLGMRSRVGTRRMRRRAFARLIMPDAYIEQHGEAETIARLEAVFGRSLTEMPQISDAQLRALRVHDERERLRELRDVPSLVLSGKQDPIATHAANVALSTGIGTAIHRVWDDASHALPIQHAAAVNDALRTHLSRR